MKKNLKPEKTAKTRDHEPEAVCVSLAVRELAPTACGAANELQLPVQVHHHR
jgi:hypothetical protein